MYKSLFPEFLSIKADWDRAISLAARHGFAGVDTSSAQIAAPDLDVARVRDLMAEAGVRPGYFGLAPGRLPVPDTDFRAALASLPLVAARAEQLGFTRAALVVLPFHETLAFDAAFAEMTARLNEINAILDAHNIALGLEYVSPLTRRAAYPHTFVHDLRGMLALCEAVQSPRVGLMLDTFHWHCAGETVADLEALSPEKIVVVHVNDAPPVPTEAQTVGERALPGATGVIDIAGFLGALRTIGYDGPITCEPMAAAITRLGAPDDEAIVEQTAQAMNRVYEL